MGKDKVISVRISEEEKKMLEKDAKKEERPISNLLIWCWKKWREKKK